MNINVVANVLLNTYSPVTVDRNAAEASINQMQKEDGYVPILLHICAQENNDPNYTYVKLAASIQAKNEIVQKWIRTKDKKTMEPHEVQREIERTKSSGKLISLQDKVEVKRVLIQSIAIQTDNRIRNTLLEILFNVIIQDFPDYYPSLTDDISKYIQSQNMSEIFGALSSLRMIFKRYQYLSEPEPTAIKNKLVDLYMNILFQVSQHLISMTNKNDDIFRMLNVIMETFHFAIVISMPSYFMNNDNLNNWMQLLLHIVNMDYPDDYISPQEIRTSENQEWGNRPLCQLKVTTFKILDHIYSRYGCPDAFDKKDPMIPFAQVFSGSFVPQFTGVFIKELERHMDNNNQYVHSNMMQHYIYSFIKRAVKYSQLYQNIVKPYVEFILTKAIPYTVTLKECDLQQYQYNPKEFSESLVVMYTIGTYKNSRQTAMSLYCYLLQKRTQSTLQLAMNYFTSEFEIISNNNNQNNNNDINNHIRTEAVLHIFGTLESLLKSHDEVGLLSANLLVKYVLPLASNSTYGFVKSRATWAAGELCNLALKYNQQGFEELVKICATNMMHNELPVKLMAVLAVSRLISQAEAAFLFLKPHAGTIIQQFFLLLDQMGHEDVVINLTLLLGKLGEDVAPFAIDVTTKLVNIFMEAMALPESDEDDETAMTAFQVLKAICPIIYAVEKKNKQLLPTMEEICMPLILRIFKDDGLEFLDDVIEICAAFSYLSENISEKMYTVILPIAVESVHTFAADYYPSMYQFFDNFICKPIPNLRILELICSTFTAAFNPNMDHYNAEYACKLMDGILAWQRGQVDQLLPFYLNLIVPKAMELMNKRKIEMEEAQRSGHIEKDRMNIDALNFGICDVIAAMAYYNPQLFLRVVSEMGEEKLKFTFNYWLQHIEYGNIRHSLSIYSLGLSALLTVPFNQVPNALQAGFNNIVSLNLSILLKFDEPADDEHNQDNKDNKNNDDDDRNDPFSKHMVFDNVPEEEDVPFDENDELDQGLMNYLANDDFDDFNFFANNDEDVIDDPSPIGEVNVFIYFQESLQLFSNHNPQMYQSWMNHAQLQPEILSVIQSANEEREYIAQNQQQS